MIHNLIKEYDFVVFGGGIFGCYAALFLAQKGYSVAIIEKENALFTKASIVNQARLHAGYHYPRSVATALMSDDNKTRFTQEHQDFINFNFEKYYAIDRFSTFTDALQFERFCAYIGLRCDRVPKHDLFDFNRIEALYLTTEYSFDPLLIAHFYQEKLKQCSNIHIFLQNKLSMARLDGEYWSFDIQNIVNNDFLYLKTPNVINATYAATNAINNIFGLPKLNLMHEISEIAFVKSPELQSIGLTVMDGQFASLMPYGKSGFLSLSSVAYTHHEVSYCDLPTFDCQKNNTKCRPSFTFNCNECSAKPSSSQHKMICQIRQYLKKEIEITYTHAYFTLKSKLKANAIDDGRPTEISILHEKPYFYCLFAGKINSIYEIEKLVKF